MKRIILFITGVLLIVLENSVINYIDIFGVTFSILLPVLVISSLYMDEVEAGVIGLLLGLIVDISVGGIFGFNALVYAIISAVIAHYKKNFYVDSTSMVMALIAISTAFQSLLMMIMSLIAYQTDGILIMILKGFIILPLLNVLVGFIIYKLFGRSIMKLMKE